LKLKYVQGPPGLGGNNEGPKGGKEDLDFSFPRKFLLQRSDDALPLRGSEGMEIPGKEGINFLHRVMVPRIADYVLETAAGSADHQTGFCHLGTPGVRFPNIVQEQFHRLVSPVEKGKI
jgi:hypothetical protein